MVSLGFKRVVLNETRDTYETQYLYPVRTQRCFDVHMTSFERYGRCIDVKTTSSAYWILISNLNWLKTQFSHISSERFGSTRDIL